MCGITGYSGTGDRRVLEIMNETLRHRGPDDGGVIISEKVGLAHRRLSVIDLSVAGHQPMSNEDGSVNLVFNGEIYNFAELRKTLTGKHTFKSQTDTEVILHLYEEIGTEVFTKIQGMFSVALFDIRKNILMLARDRMGKKPLYWGIYGNTLVFGSELKSLMKHPSFRKEIDMSSVNKYMQYEYVPTPHTLFKNTYKLEPGTFLVWDGIEAKKTVFWQPTFIPKTTSFRNSMNKLDVELTSAVTDRLVSEVPLGVFLSGGLDSSTIAYYATRAHKNIKTFSIGFKKTSFDESRYARQVSGFLGTDHHEKILSVHDCLAMLPDIIDSLDEPLADASIVPTYLLSQFAREHVTVALGGDGGDELFCGYDPILAHRLAPLYQRIPVLIRRQVVERIVDRLPTSSANMSLDFKLKKFVHGFDENPLYRNQRWLGAFDRTERANLFKAEVWNSIKSVNEFEDIDSYVQSTDSHELFDELTLLYERMYMMDQVLVKVDRASMMNSLEVRAPFLDTRVVDLANHMPTSFKFKGLERKYILKKLMEGKLPNDIIYRKKKGFGMPIAEWIRGDLKPLVCDVLGKNSIDSMGFFDAAYIERIVNEHMSGRKDNRKQIWTLLMLGLWWRKWGK